MTTTVSKRKERGQVMVLACVAMVLCALMLMTTFNLTNAIHEKIRIQSHSDAAAYSMATIEARAFNMLAHHNRAIAAALVAQMSLHSWMAIATNDVAMLSSGAIIMLAIAGIETAMGCYPYNISHCPCVIQALISAFRFFRAANQWGNKLRGLESQFNKGVEKLKEMVDKLNDAQKGILDRTKTELMFGLSMQSLQSTNASGSSYMYQLAFENTEAMACALEGTKMDDDCKSGNRHHRAKSSAADRSKVMQNAANAARPALDNGNMPSFGAQAMILSHQNFAPPYNPDVPKDALTDGNWMHVFATEARVGSNTSSGSQSSSEAKNVGAGNKFAVGIATVIGFKHVPVMAMPFSGNVYSGSPNQHNGLLWMRGHSGSHDKFKHIVSQDVCEGENCFVNYRSTNEATKDFGFPSVYSGVSQSLRMYQTKNGDFKENAPWEINQDGEVKIKFTDQEAKLKVTSREDGKALSKAKVYFHQLGDWRAPPNFFDPFWRAKLHFFKRDEFKDIIKITDPYPGFMMTNMGAPVEGEKQ